MAKTRYTIDIRTISEANTRGHWAKNHKLHKDQNLLANLTTRAALAGLPKEHPFKKVDASINIKIIRVSAGTMDDDNVRGSSKWIRDGIADALAPGLAPGRADGLARFTWEYEQKKCKRGTSRIEIILSLKEKV